MKILLTGATGFVGKRLARALAKKGHSLNVLSRNSRTAGARLGLPVQAWAWNPETETAPGEAFAGVDAVINLAGEGIAEKRWSDAQKKKIKDSRVLGTTNLLKGLKAATPRTRKSSSALRPVGITGTGAMRL